MAGMDKFLLEKQLLKAEWMYSEYYKTWGPPLSIIQNIEFKDIYKARDFHELMTDEELPDLPG